MREKDPGAPVTGWSTAREIKGSGTTFQAASINKEVRKEKKGGVGERSRIVA